MNGAHESRAAREGAPGTTRDEAIADAASASAVGGVAPPVVGSTPGRRVPAAVFTAPVLVALATVYVVWGSTYFAIHLALASFPPFLQGGVRFATAGALLFGFLAARGRPMPSGRQWRDGAIVGTLLLAGGNGGVVVAEQFVPSSVAAIFIGAGPLVAALWSGLFGVWPRRVQWAGIVLGFAGVVLLAGGAQLSGSPLGLGALVASVSCWTFGSTLAQQRLAVAPGAMGFATEMLAGGAAMIAIGLASGETGRLVAAWPPTPAATAALAYLIAVGSLAGFSAYMYLLSAVPSSIALSYAYVNPLIAVFLGVAFAGEALTTREAIATAVVVGSVVLMTRGPRRGG